MCGGRSTALDVSDAPHCPPGPVPALVATGSMQPTPPGSLTPRSLSTSPAPSTPPPPVTTAGPRCGPRSSTSPPGSPPPADAWSCTCPATGPGPTPGTGCTRSPPDRHPQPPPDHPAPTGTTKDNSGKAGQTGSPPLPRTSTSHRNPESVLTKSTSVDQDSLQGGGNGREHRDLARLRRGLHGRSEVTVGADDQRRVGLAPRRTGSPPEPLCGCGLLSGRHRFLADFLRTKRGLFSLTPGCANGRTQ
jgi:hypothetical protein